MQYSIYLVEDEIKLSILLKGYLEREGYIVTTFPRGNDALEKMEDHPHLWVLDIMLPDIDGYEVIKSIRKVDSNTPVIFMSARDSDIDRLLGLQLGSDDYISKPFLPQELVIRCNNIIKRLYGKTEDTLLMVNGYQLDLEKRMVYRNDEEVKLTTKEYELLSYFVQNKNKSLSRDQILNHVWSMDFFGNERVVDDLIRRLKKKCEGLNIEAIYGYGYRLS